MYCISCGAELPDKTAFCTNCGQPTTPAGGHAAPAGGAAFPQGAAPGSPAPDPQPPRKKRGVLVASIVVIVLSLCAIGAVAGYATGLFGSADPAQGQRGHARLSEGSESADASKSAKSPSAESADSSSASGPATGDGSSSASSAASGDASSSAARKAAPLVDLSKPGDYYDLNIFLSNFAEWPEFYRYRWTSFDRANYNTEQLVNWAMWHNALNNDGTLVHKKTTLKGAPNASWTKVVDVDGGPKPDYLRHMDTSLIRNSISRYLGIDLDLSGYTDDDGDYCERGGVMYEGSYRGSADTYQNVILCDSAANEGADTVAVEFTLYLGREPEIVSNKDWYGLSGDELESAMSAAGASPQGKLHGTAVVQVSGSGTDRSFTLVKFSVDED